ncbi:MAG: hypothetical protein D3913_08335 [Candidatus Electrothrix sp. LOE1_4_5]|nr:hypothetical protein [Candidatus Electrothrix gigas]
MYISSLSLRFNLKLLVVEVASVCILSGCIAVEKQKVLPYQDWPIPPETSETLPSSNKPVSSRSLLRQPFTQSKQQKLAQSAQFAQSAQTLQAQQQNLQDLQGLQRLNEQHFSEKKTDTTGMLQPINETVRSRVSFYAQKARSWQELEQHQVRYYTPEQSRKRISCQRKVDVLHDAYTELQVELLNDRNIAASYEKVIITLQQLQRKDFSYLEGECPALFQQLSKLPERFMRRPVFVPSRTGTPEVLSNTHIVPSRTAHFDRTLPQQSEQISPQIQQYNQDQVDRYGQYNNQYSNQYSNPYSQDSQQYEYDEYGEDEQDTGQQPLSPQPAPNYEERYQYAQSLLKQGKKEEARSVLSDLLASVRQTGNSTLQIKVLKQMSELEFALKNYLPARVLYEELQELNVSFDRQHLMALQAVASHQEEVDAYASLLLSSMTFDPQHDGFTITQQARAFLHNFPNSPLHSHVKKLVAKAEEKAEQWFQELIQQSDQLVVNQHPQEALTVLENVPLDILPLDKQEIIRQRIDALTSTSSVQVDSAQQPLATTSVPVEPVPVLEPDHQDMIKSNSDSGNNGMSQSIQERQQQGEQEQAELIKQQEPVPQTTSIKSNELEIEKKFSEYGEKNPQHSSGSSQQVVQTSLEKKWGKAEAALQASEYDKAIALFSDLLNTSMDTQAREKIKKVSLTAGQEARQEAAIFFQRAKSTTNLRVKRQHLLSSQKILKGILQKYPHAGLDTKVKRNLSRVEKELTALDQMPFE